jgi:hypothetical protein
MALRLNARLVDTTEKQNTAVGQNASVFSKYVPVVLLYPRVVSP